MEENNRYNYDDTDDEERPRRRLKKNGLDIKPFEINSCRRTLMRSVEDPSKLLLDADYSEFLKSLWLESEPSSSPIEGDDDSDEEDDLDPQYMMFLENLKEYGSSYKLEIATKNGMMSVMYEGEDESDDECGLQSPVKVKKVLKRKGEEADEDPILGHDRGRVRDGVMEETLLKSEAAKCMGNNPSRNRIGTRRSPRLCNNMMDSTRNLRSNIERATTQKSEGDVKSRVAKDLKNIPIRMEVETHTSLRSGGRKLVEYTRMDKENNEGREKGKSMEEKDFKSKRANHPQAKRNENCGKKSSGKGDGIFGCDFHLELNDDDVDECYRTFLNSVKVESNYILYAVEGQKPVKLEQFDVECSSDSEVVVTSNASEFNEGGCNPFQTTNLSAKPDNQLQCFRSCEGDIQSVFRKKLMAKIGEPYDDEEYKKLWNDINNERQKVKHIDLRGSGAMKQFLMAELRPSYLATYASLKKKIDALGLDRHKRLKFLRAFFFWLQNVAHDDAFIPWLDKKCLEMMRR